ncbi:hypothetical protein ACGFZP_16480 [Kitasatospora sp. NPDC048239]|uniref:hypothetical protein n=1 Tax=Kitasatospora sp. NPDC048239 TaxID=3364046 RepID=UPI00371C4F85
MTTPLPSFAGTGRLAAPSPDTPVIPAHLVVERHAHLASRYADQLWSLAPLIDNPAQRLPGIDWRRCPPAVRPELRLIAWTMLNGQLPNSFVRERGNRMRARLAPTTARDTVWEWMRLARWMEQQGHRTLAGADRAVLHAYGLHVRGSGRDRHSVRNILLTITRLWAFDQLAPARAGIALPPWDEDGLDDYLPAATPAGAENKREPLAEQTMGPLLIWAVRLVEDLTDDILAAHTEARRINEAARTCAATAAGRRTLDTYLAELIASGRPPPGTTGPP